MKADLPFLELRPTTRVDVRFDGETLELAEGMNLAAALLLSGVRVFRQCPANGEPRAPWCMMGACFECLVEIDGVVQQACMLEVVGGMDIKRTPRVGELDAEL